MKKSSNIVIGGISVALITVILYAGSIIPTNKIFLMALAIVIGSIPCIIGGTKTSLIVYLSSSILGFIIVPNKFYVGIYIIFGLYPVIKYISEKYSAILEYTIKYITFNVLVLVAYFIYENFIYISPLLDNAVTIIVVEVLLQIIFFIFDFAFTKFIMLIEDRVLKNIKRI